MGIYRLGLFFAKIRGKQKVLQRFPECCKDFHVPTVKIFTLEEKLCLHKYRAHQAASFSFFKMSLRLFSAELLRKTG